MELKLRITAKSVVCQSAIPIWSQSIAGMDESGRKLKNDQSECEREDLRRNDFPKENEISKIFVIPQSRLKYKNRE
jgi:hypothetical protein